MWFFFYGTLMDAEVRHAVLGRRLPAAACVPAVLDGYRRVFRAEATFPVLLPAPGEAVDGVRVGRLRPADVARLVAFEGDDYVTAERLVRLASGDRTAATVFLPAPGCPATDREWTPTLWHRQHRRQFLRAVRWRSSAEPAEAAAPRS